MKKAINLTTAIILFFVAFSVILSKEVLADLTPPGYTPGYKHVLGGHLSDLFQPEYIVVGIIVTAVVIISLVLLFKIRKKK